MNDKLKTNGLSVSLLSLPQEMSEKVAFVGLECVVVMVTVHLVTRKEHFTGQL